MKVEKRSKILFLLAENFTAIEASCCKKSKTCETLLLKEVVVPVSGFPVGQF